MRLKVGDKVIISWLDPDLPQPEDVAVGMTGIVDAVLIRAYMVRSSEFADVGCFTESELTLHEEDLPE